MHRYCSSMRVLIYLLNAAFLLPSSVFTVLRCVMSVTSLPCTILHTFLVCSLEAGLSLSYNLQRAGRCLHVFSRCWRFWRWMLTDKCQSCDRAFRLFIGDGCEESLLLPDTDTAHKIIWAFQGLKETGTAFGNIWTTISMSGSRCLDEISRDDPQHWVAMFAYMLYKWYSRCCHDCIYVRIDRTFWVSAQSTLD